MRNEQLFRPEALAFQRRRLAGEVALKPSSGLRIASLGLLAGVGALGIGGWFVSAPATLALPCVARAGGEDVRVEIPAAAVGREDTIRTLVIRLGEGPPARFANLSSWPRTVSLPRQAVAPAAACRVEADLRVRPLRLALLRLLPGQGISR